MEAEIRADGEFLISGPPGTGPFSLTASARLTGLAESTGANALGDGQGETSVYALLYLGAGGGRVDLRDILIGTRDFGLTSDTASATIDETLSVTLDGLLAGDLIGLGFQLRAFAASEAPGSAYADLTNTLQMRIDYAALPAGVGLQPVSGTAFAPPPLVPLPAAGVGGSSPAAGAPAAPARPAPSPGAGAAARSRARAAPS